MDVFIPRGDGLFSRSSRHASATSAGIGGGLLREAGLEGWRSAGCSTRRAGPDADELRHLKVLYSARRVKGGAPQ